MSKKQLLKDNVLAFVGGNIANALNYLLNIFLKRVDDHLFNIYTIYSSITLLVLVPSLVTMRTFTVFGSPALLRTQNWIEKHRRSFITILILCSLSLIPMHQVLVLYVEDASIIVSILFFLLAIVGLVATVFRGLRQNIEDFKTSVISINVEALGRVFLGYIFAVTLHMGAYGILLGHICGLIVSLIICYDRDFFTEHVDAVSNISIKQMFVSSAIMTLGLEFISNFDIIYANYILQSQDELQTEFNTLQFFRKIIFFGTFSVSSVILSINVKGNHTKRFSFLFTLAVGLLIGIGLGGFFFLFRDIFYKILDTTIITISNTEQIFFLISTLCMSTSYLLVNWLFTLQKRFYMFISIIVSIMQFCVFLLYGKDIHTLLQAYLITSTSFFVFSFIVSLYEGIIVDRKKAAHGI